MSTALMMLSEAAPAAAEKSFEISGPMVVASWEMFGITWNLTESVIVQWIVMLVILAVCLILGTGLKAVPTTRRQALAEMLISALRGMVNDGMGTKYKAYIPYIGILMVYVMFNSLISLFGLRAPMADVSV
ncbi:MAG: F0F1 ATP synthase subunit A, partial [Oscillospiraceae bacterium]|nr:F0F1 ATP synthase subunit A [Oscillospiraceae bacterium]